MNHEILSRFEMKAAFGCVALFLVCVFLVAPIARVNADLGYVSLLNSLDADRAWNTVHDLAGDLFEGRRAGTRGAELASEYIADDFKATGLQPAGTDGTYRTRFALPLWQLAQMPSLMLVDSSGKVLQDFQYRKDFNIVPGSDSGNYSAHVAFVGYGITATSLGYDDYSGISARGKIVLAITGVPASGRFNVGDYGSTYVKAENALSHGAVGMIIVDTPAAPTPHYIERWRCGGCWTIFHQLTILGGTTEIAETLLKDNGLTLEALQQGIDENLLPGSFDSGSQLHVSVQVSYTARADGYNVLGFLPGTDRAAHDSAVIIGAHYDHWGKDVDGKIFRGANDDASGVAVMMEVARVFSYGARPRWSVLFAAWSGEEEGLYGSYDYVSHPSFPLSGTVAYLDLDMVGYGHPLLGEISEAHQRLRSVMSESAGDLDVSVNTVGYSGGSDNVPFEERSVPNLMFIYWPDDAYHTPGDTAEHVSRTNLLETAKITALIALRLSEATVSPTTAAATPDGVSPPTTIFTTPIILAGAAVLVIAVAAVALRFKRREK